MAKAIKIAAVVVGVAALAVVTGGAAAGLGISLATSVAGISASTLLVGAGALSALGSVLTKAPSIPSAQTERLNASIDPRAFRKTALGQTALATDVRYEEWSGSDQDYCDWIVALASHRIDGVEEIWLNDELAWSAATGVGLKFRGYLTVPNIVLEGAPHNAFSFASGKWNGSARLTGCAYLRLRFKVTGNGKKAESPFSGGPPSRITIIGRGAPLYDPRRDGTVPGGSGPMRAHDQSTWRYVTDDGVTIGENLPLQILRVLLGWRIANPATGMLKLATGCGIAPRRLLLASWIVAANLADEAVNRAAGGSEPRYHGAGLVSEGDDPRTALDALCAACCSRLRDAGGRLSIAVAHNDLAAAALDDGLDEDDVVGGFTWDPDPAFEETPNVIRGRYVDASAGSLYQLIDYPEVRLPSLDGQDRIASLDLGYVESVSHAQRVAKQVLQRKQYQRSFSAPFDIRAWTYGVGDVVPFTFAPLSFERKLFRVAEQELGQGGICNMTLTVETAAIYAWDASDAPPVQAAEANSYDASRSPLVLAIGEAATTALWSGVAGEGKPADNATNTRDTAAPFGPDRTVGEVEQAITTALAGQQDFTDNVVPALSSRVQDASDRIDAEITRAVGAEDVLSERISNVVANGGGYDDAAIYARVQEIDTARKNADVALANRQVALSARARTGTGIVTNSDFSAWPDGQPVPTGWAIWEGGGPGRYDDGEGGWWMGINNFQTNGGLVQLVEGLTPGLWVLEARAKHSQYANFFNVGLVMHLTDDNGAGTGEFVRSHFADQVGGGADDRWYNFSQLVEVPDRGRQRNRAAFHLMTRDTGFGAGNSTNNSIWAWARVRPATDGEIKARAADAALNQPGGVIARIDESEATLIDLPNRFATAQRAATLEAQVAGTAASGLNTNLTARIEDRATTIADSKVGPVVEATQTLSTRVDSAVSTLQEQAGIITGLDGRTSVFLSVTATLPDGASQLRLSRRTGETGTFFLSDTNLIVDGNITATGSIYGRSIADNAVSNNVAAIGADTLTGPGAVVELIRLTIDAAGSGFVRVDFSAVSSFFGDQEDGGTDYNGNRIYLVRLRQGQEQELISQAGQYTTGVQDWVLEQPGAGPVTYILRGQDFGAAPNTSHSRNYSRIKLAVTESKK